MPLQLPNLDDRRYADLVEEARSLIPTYEPRWTNHNASDPGITLVELFAYLSEMLLYRLNRVTSKNVLSFLKLLNGTNWDPFNDQANDQAKEKQLTDDEIKLEKLSADELARLIAQQLPNTIKKLRKLERAVSCADFEALALQAPEAFVIRARCLPRLHIEVDPKQERPGHVSLIVLPKQGLEQEEQNLEAMIKKVKDYLAPRLLLTTHLHVVGPFFVEITITVYVALMADQREEGIQERVGREIKKFFDPMPDAERNTPGWPFGRNVFISEIFALLDQLPFIDYVTAVEAAADDPERKLPKGPAPMMAIEVKPYELVKVKQVTVYVVAGSNRSEQSQ